MFRKPVYFPIIPAVIRMSNTDRTKSPLCTKLTLTFEVFFHINTSAIMNSIEPIMISRSSIKLKYTSIMPSIVIANEKSIAEKGVALKESIIKFIIEMIIQKEVIITNANDSLENNIAKENVAKMMR